MARRWDREDWRKLYSRVDARWLALPLLTRGLGSELLKYAERPSGTIAVHEGESADDAVIRLLAAHRSEVAAVRKAVKQLIADGYLVVMPGAISIKNFEEAQARSSNAERQARFRRDHAPLNQSVTSNGHGDVTFGEQQPLRSDGSRDRALPGACTLTTSSLSGSGSGSPDQEDLTVTAPAEKPTLGEAILAELQRHRVFGPIAIREIADALAMTAFDRKRSPEEAAACVREAGLKQSARAAGTGAPTLDKLIDWVQACISAGSRANSGNASEQRRGAPRTDVQRGGWNVQSVIDGTDPETAHANEQRRLAAERDAKELTRINAERRARGEDELEEVGQW